VQPLQTSTMQAPVVWSARDRLVHSVSMAV
jgi:hypothetical protein